MQHVLATHLKLHALGPGLLSPLGSLGRMRSPLGCATGGCWWLKPLEAGRSWLVDRGYPLMDCDNPTHNPIISVESSTKHHLSVISTHVPICSYAVSPAQWLAELMQKNLTVGRTIPFTNQPINQHPYRIHGAAIYGNMDPINIPQMLAYIPYMDPMGNKPVISSGNSIDL